MVLSIYSNYHLQHLQTQYFDHPDKHLFAKAPQWQWHLYLIAYSNNSAAKTIQVSLSCDYDTSLFYDCGIYEWNITSSWCIRHWLLEELNLFELLVDRTNKLALCPLFCRILIWSVRHAVHINIFNLII